MRRRVGQLSGVDAALEWKMVEGSTALPWATGHLFRHRKHSIHHVRSSHRRHCPEYRERDLDEPDPKAGSIIANDIESIGASRSPSV
jgi:hypothetical protein